MSVDSDAFSSEFEGAYTREEIEKKIARGFVQIERGETVDGETAFRQLREFSAEQRRARKCPTSLGE